VDEADVVASPHLHEQRHRSVDGDDGFILSLEENTIA
jgi:hypothetical protein